MYVNAQRKRERTHHFFIIKGLEMVETPLISLCLGRSGDKGILLLWRQKCFDEIVLLAIHCFCCFFVGDVANIGLIARDKQFYPFLLATLTEEV